MTYCRIYLALAAFTLVVTVCAAQANVNGRAVTELGVGGAAKIAAVTKTAEGQSKDVNRASILASKAEKLWITLQIDDQKRQNDSLQRAEIGKLVTTLNKTLEDFKDLYEKFKLIRTAVRSIAEGKKFTERIAGLLEVLVDLTEFVTTQSALSPEEIELFEGMIARMGERADRIIDLSALALLDDSSTGPEMDAIREEHGEFFVLMKSLDRTAQIAALNNEIADVTSDLHTLHTNLAYVTRARAKTYTDGMRTLYGY